MRELLLLRHGRTASNERRTYTGAMDVPLSPGGREELAGRRGTYPPARAFFTSGMLRARETLEILYGPVAHKSIPDLGEYRFGRFEGRTHDELYAQEPLYRQWLEPENMELICPGGESRRMFDERVRRGFFQLAAESWEGLAVLVCHGGVIASVMRQLAPREAPYGTPGNGGGWLVRLGRSGKVAECWEHP